MSFSRNGILAMLAAIVLAGCASGGSGGYDTQSFLGINQDIHSVFQSENDYLNPLRLNE
ncbi:MAG: hypothetical protein JO010_01030 [Alphaproteobacteria bacterium]|nr:hypothetical protein [Alphaproteobacteria bacterium]